MVKHGNKRKKGKVDSALTAEHIGEPNRKCAADNDPYGAGEQSGKRAKPDARSAAANARARAAQVLKAEPPPTQPAPPLTPLPLPVLSPTLPPRLHHSFCPRRPHHTSHSLRIHTIISLTLLSRCLNLSIPIIRGHRLHVFPFSTYSHQM
jgi:hypothetical protein